MKNFKIADIKAESRYTVTTVDYEDSETETKIITGEQLVSFAQAASHLYDIHAEEVDENREYCKRIVDELEAYAAGTVTNEDGEEMSLYDYISDALDIQYIVDGRRVYQSCRIYVALGGPTVWIDTEEKAVKLAWGTGRAEYGLDWGVCDEIDNIMDELWEVQ